MKKVLILVSSILFIATHLFSGPITSGGGKSEAGKYQALSYSIKEHIAENKDQFPEVDLEALDETIRMTRILFVYEKIKPENYPSDIALDAFSDGEAQTTTINNVSWNQRNFIEKQVIALHENLVLMGIENHDNYFVSSRLFEKSLSFSAKTFDQLEENAYFAGTKKRIFNDFEWGLSKLESGEFEKADFNYYIGDMKLNINAVCITVLGLKVKEAEKNIFKRYFWSKEDSKEILDNCLAHFSPIFSFEFDRDM